MRQNPKVEPDPRFDVRDNPDAKVWGTEPSKSAIDDLREHTRATGKPDEWKWHCHSRPSSDEVPQIIAVGIDVPEKLRPDVGLAPCPLCSLHGPRYYEGMLAWWPKEKALRVIGHECGHHLYGAAFVEAKKDYRHRASDEAALDALIETLPIVPAVRAWINTTQPQARKLDETRTRLLRGLGAKTAASLYRHIGPERTLKLIEEVWEPIYGKDGAPVIDANGNHARRPALRTVAHLPIAACEALDKPRQMVEPLLYRAHVSLEPLGLVNPETLEDLLISWGADRRIENAPRIREAFGCCRAAYNLATVIQAFLASHNLDDLCSFARDSRAPIKVRIRRERFGRYELGDGRKSIVLINETPEITTPITPPPI